MGHHNAELRLLQRPWPLPVLPRVLAGLCDQLNEAPFAPLPAVKLISHEPALMVQVLRAAPTRTTDSMRLRDHLRAAVEALGASGLELLLNEVLAHHLPRYLDAGLAKRLEQRWRQTLWASLCAKHLAAELDPGQEEFAYACTLLSALGGWLEFGASGADCPQRPGSAVGEAPAELAASQALLAGIAPLRLVSEVMAYAQRPAADLEHALPLVKILAVSRGLAADDSATRGTFVGDLLARYCGLNPAGFEQALAKARAELAICESWLVTGPNSERAQHSPTAMSSPTQDAAADAPLPPALTRHLSRRLLSGAVHTWAELARAATDQADALEQLAQALCIQYQAEPLLAWQHRSGSGAESAALHCCYCSDPGLAQHPLLQRLPLTLSHAPGRACLDGQPVLLGLQTSASLGMADRQLLDLIGTAGALCLAIGDERADRPAEQVLLLGLPQTQLGDDQNGLAAQVARLAESLLATPTRHTAGGLEAGQQGRGRGVDEAPGLNASQPQLDRLLVRKTVHEIRTPLSVMKNYLAVLRQKVAATDPACDELVILGEEIDRVGDLLRELTDAARDEPPAWVSVNALVTDMIALIGKQQGEQGRVAIRVDLDPDLPSILSIRDRIKQILLNLIKNAMEAQPTGGLVEVLTRRVGGSAPERILLEVRDQGPGLSEAVRARLFEPFNSSKSDQGRGLGLHIVRTAVASLAGQIRVRSEPGAGTAFVIELPVQFGSAPAPKAAGKSVDEAPNASVNPTARASEDQVSEVAGGQASLAHRAEA